MSTCSDSLIAMVLVGLTYTRGGTWGWPSCSNTHTGMLYVTPAIKSWSQYSCSSQDYDVGFFTSLPVAERMCLEDQVSNTRNLIYILFKCKKRKLEGQSRCHSLSHWTKNIAKLRQILGPQNGDIRVSESPPCIYIPPVKKLTSGLFANCGWRI